MTDSINLSRKQLSMFLPTQELIRTFERLLHIVSSLDPQSYDNLVAEIGSINDQITVLNSTIAALNSAIASSNTDLNTVINMIEPQVPYNDTDIKNRLKLIETYLGI